MSPSVDSSSSPSQPARSRRWLWIALSIAAGVCEETLFRGCLQARLGIVATVVLFASLHIQYGVSIFLLVVVVDGFVFALLRKYFDTTTAAIAHASCDALLSIQLSGEWVLIALAVQAFVLPFVIWSSRDRLALLLAIRRVHPEPASP